MASRSGLDIDALLAPISEDNPCGKDVRENLSPTSNYQLIKIARNTARSVERNSMFADDGQQADDSRRKIDESWRKVAELAPKILRSEGKDLEVACWYAEARVRRDGFEGLAESFSIIEGLIGLYWDGLFPMPDEYGLETRVSPLAGLNGEGSEGVLMAPIRNSVITNSGQARPYTYWEYQQAVETQRIADEKARNAQANKQGFTLAQIETAVRDSSNDFFTDLRDQLNESLASYSAVSEKLNTLCGTHEAPPTSNIINLIKECLNTITHLGKNKFPAVALVAETLAEDDQVASEGATGETAAVNGAKLVLSAVANREHAFKQLMEIADFFRKTEPHSPVSYAIEKAVKWGNMPLHELISELIPDKASRGHFSELTGVKTEN